MKTLVSLLLALGLASTAAAQHDHHGQQPAAQPAAQAAPAARPANVPADAASLTMATSARCGMCKQTLEKNLAFERGVYASRLDMQTKGLTVWYNPAKTTPAALRTAVSKTGYDADDVPADQKAHDRLEPCCQKSATPHRD